jgi:hypothetical protein
MNPESRLTARGLLARIGGVLLGVLVLYALGSGPATYYSVCYHNSLGRSGSARGQALLQTAYRPLGAGVAGTSLETLLVKYQGWWILRAQEKYPILWYDL